MTDENQIDYNMSSSFIPFIDILHQVALFFIYGYFIQSLYDPFHQFD
jgi:hypothetical protein